jgi:hypothetical protein
MKQFFYNLDLVAADGYSSYAPIVMLCLLPVVVYGLYRAMPGLIAHFKSVK